MLNILIISEVKSFLTASIKQSFEELSYRVTVLPADTNAINEHRETVHGIFIYADENLMEQTNALYFLKDRATSESIPVFAMGVQEQLAVISSVFSENLLLQSFLRPIRIHVSSIVSQIDRSIRQNSSMKRILAVDDSSVMLRTIKGWLEHKYNVFLANSGTMAIRYLALNQPDLILMDYAMPVADGKQILKMIRSEPDFADIPVIFLTKIEDKQSIIDVQELKLDGYLLKSLPPAAIIKAIDDFFENQKQFPSH